LEGEKEVKKNVLVAQSGGPSPVINSSLKGVIDAWRAHPDKFGKLYGGWHGIEGVLKEELIDISEQEQREIDLLATTPAAGVIGTCRYKLRDVQGPDFERVLQVFKAHDVGFFFYIGGNDSMDTAHKISRLARERGVDLVVTGVPKTIDNDVGDPEFKLLDHTPGYGSVSRYWAYYIQNANEENAGACTSDPVLVMQVMGRKVGFIPAAARLGDPERRMPMQIYMPESGYTLEHMTDFVNDEVKRSGRCLVVVSEGFDVGSLGEKHDAFGHIDYAASENTVAQAVINHLNQKGLSARGRAAATVSGQDQRDTSIFASTVDLQEAHGVALHAVTVALKDGTGWMATILRHPGLGYRPYFDKVPLDQVANSERRLPSAWLSKNKLDVTDDFVRYARPLIGEEWPKIVLENGIQRFARFKKVFADRKCPAYLPEGHR
jgi:6-phosphofructokinase 1